MGLYGEQYIQNWMYVCVVGYSGANAQMEVRDEGHADFGCISSFPLQVFWVSDWTWSNPLAWLAGGKAPGICLSPHPPTAASEACCPTRPWGRYWGFRLRFLMPVQHTLFSQSYTSALQFTNTSLARFSKIRVCFFFPFPKFDEINVIYLSINLWRKRMKA